MQLEFMAIQDTLAIQTSSTQENSERIIQCIYDFGFGSFNQSTQDFTKPGNIIQLGYPPLRIDLLTEIDGVSFSECYSNRKEVEIDNLVVNFIGYWDLLKNKEKSGRHKDLDDIENLKDQQPIKAVWGKAEGINCSFSLFLAGDFNLAEYSNALAPKSLQHYL